MKNPKRPFKSLFKSLALAAFAAAALVLGARSVVFAQATIEYYGENGTNPPPTGLNWFGGGNASWFEATDGNTPEGTRYQAFTSLTGTQGYWGFSFAATQNMSAYAGGQIRFLLKSTEDLSLQIQWSTGNNAVVIRSTGGQWKEVVWDLSNFTGIDLTQITVPFLIQRALPNTGQTTWYVDHIRWTKRVATMQIIPTSPWFTNGRHRQFTVVGKDSNGDETVIYSTWTATGTGSSASPNGPSNPSRYTILTIGSANGTLKAETTTDNVPRYSTSTSFGFSVGAAQDTTLGLLSETNLNNLVFGTDSDFGTYNGGGATITTGDNTSDFREGTKSTQVTMNVPAGGYAGFFIQAGVSGSAETVTRDMSNYYDGSIRFWMKAPAALSGLLNLSIRTGGVGTEQSKIALTNGVYGVNYDNNWHPVVIPVAQFAKAVPFAELSNMKILFNMSVVANTGGAQTFYIDNLRWDTLTPGALDHITVTPASVTLPKNLKRFFVANGFDVNNVPVDIYPSWSMTGGIGTLNTTNGTNVQLTAANTATSGTLTATDSGKSGSSNVTVANVTFTQIYNVFTDAGSGGQIGVDSPAPGSMTLNGQHKETGAPEGSTVMHTTYTVSGAGNYSTWFVYEVTGSRYMSAYSNGYLHFYVKAAHDLEVSIRSNNVDPATNRAKFRLSALGVPLNNQWQEVWLSLDDFHTLEPNTDFTQVKVYFGIAAIQSEVGNLTNEVFEVDGVAWYTASSTVPDPTKVYQGLKEKQNSTTGLVLTFDNDATNRAVTYDQALAAMAYTYQQDTALAKKVLDVFLGKYNAAGGSFAGFAAEYDRDTPSTIRNPDREVGPNAWIMLAALHYKIATGSTIYDNMIIGIGQWMATLKDSENALRLGYQGSPGTLMNEKSTEMNLDAYAAYNAYASATGDTQFNALAGQIFNWLSTQAWTGTRFNVGDKADLTANPDYALDVYSWSALALSSYTSVIDQAESVFGTTKTIDVNGLSMTGFDFSGTPGSCTGGVYGALPDKDSVWIEGTAQMVVAYLFEGNQTKATQYLNELNKAVYTVGTSSQALTYATNAGTAYWCNTLMDSTHGAASSMSWYLFANWGFNPLQPMPLFDYSIRNISDNQMTQPAIIGWSVAPPVPQSSRWVRANQYVQFRTNPTDTRPWGLQIYTDNANPANTPHFVDPTPSVSTNTDSSPAGLMLSTGNVTSSNLYMLTFGWRVQDSTGPAPVAAQPYNTLQGNGDFNWFYFKDKHTPAIDTNGNGTTTDPGDITAFQNGDDYITVKSNLGLHTTAGNPGTGYFPTLGDDYIFFEADFSNAGANTSYKAFIDLEFFIQ